MGYTHYWRQPPTLDKERFLMLGEDVKELLSRLPKASLSAGGYFSTEALIIAGMGGDGDPQITSDLIGFNGAEPNEYESFCFERVRTPRYTGDAPDAETGLWFTFCKTARNPYDLMVCATLLLVKHHLPEVQVKSDGDPDDWESARAWYTQVFNRALPSDGPWKEVEV